MIWAVVTNSKDVSGGLDILLKPCNDVVRFAILQYKIRILPNFVYEVSESLSTGIEYVHIRFMKDMDLEDKAWAKNVKGSNLVAGEMFLIHDVIGKTIIKEELFDKILFDYGSKVLEIYQSDTSLPKTWNDEMIKALYKLKLKIDRSNA